MTPASLAAVAAGAAAVVTGPLGDPVRRLGPRDPGTAAPADEQRGRAGAWIAVVVLSAIGLSAVGGRRYFLIALGGLSASAIVRRMRRMHRTRTCRRRRQRDVIRLCDELAAEARSGIPALIAVERACADQAELGSVISTARLGGDLASALRRGAERPGAEGLRAVAAAWEVANTSGTGLALVLDRIAAGLRSDEDARAEVIASLAPPRATARLLAVLPLFGLALGSSIGADPVHFLLATQGGLGCLAGGAVLALTGVWWVEKLASAAEV